MHVYHVARVGVSLYDSFDATIVSFYLCAGIIVPWLIAEAAQRRSAHLSYLLDCLHRSSLSSNGVEKLTQGSGDDKYNDIHFV